MRRWWIVLVAAAVMLGLKLGMSNCGWPRAQALLSSLWMLTELERILCHALTISGLTMLGTIRFEALDVALFCSPSTP